ncbi:phosphatase PAP2 family protein [Cellulomonas sp. McL0617]|uniref:phosphatase PAP2 family protein n=1 Tax=Cellulomonas sp. McL0617 TaxID=3415675 RepID=UPI003CF42AB9
MSRTVLRPAHPDPRASRATAVAGARARRLVRAVVAGVGTAAALLLLGLLVRDRWDPLVRFDERTVVAATSFAARYPALVRALLDWQWAFEGVHLFVPVAALCLLVWWRTRMTSRTWWALATIATAWAFANLAKEVARRARPVLDDPIDQVRGYSFPSGHAANTAAMATALVVLVWPVLRSRGLRVAAVLGAAALMVLTGLDRVMLGAHFPSDVLAGTVFGVGLVLASYLGYRGWSPPHDDTTEGSTDRTSKETR